MHPHPTFSLVFLGLRCSMPWLLCSLELSLCLFAAFFPLRAAETCSLSKPSRRTHLALSCLISDTLAPTLRWTCLDSLSAATSCLWPSGPRPSHRPAPLLPSALAQLGNRSTTPALASFCPLVCSFVPLLHSPRPVPRTGVLGRALSPVGQGRKEIIESWPSLFCLSVPQYPHSVLRAL